MRWLAAMLACGYAGLLVALACGFVGGGLLISETFGVKRAYLRDSHHFLLLDWPISATFGVKFQEYFKSHQKNHDLVV